MKKQGLRLLVDEDGNLSIDFFVKVSRNKHANKKLGKHQSWRKRAWGNVKKLLAKLCVAGLTVLMRVYLARDLTALFVLKLGEVILLYKMN